MYCNPTDKHAETGRKQDHEEGSRTKHLQFLEGLLRGQWACWGVSWPDQCDDKAFSIRATPYKFPSTDKPVNRRGYLHQCTQSYTLLHYINLVLLWQNLVKDHVSLFFHKKYLDGQGRLLTLIKCVIYCIELIVDSVLIISCSWSSSLERDIVYSV